MTGITFYKEKNSIKIKRINLIDGNYFADISFSKDGKDGIANNQSLNKLAIKIIGELFKIKDDILIEHKIKIFENLFGFVR